ncbi:MAG: BstYI, partial [Bacillota bacterium]
MKIVYEYSHLGGSEILIVRYPEINQQIYDVIHEIKAARAKVSHEKTMRGKMLFSPVDMNADFSNK